MVASHRPADEFGISAILESVVGGFDRLAAQRMEYLSPELWRRALQKPRRLAVIEDHPVIRAAHQDRGWHGGKQRLKLGLLVGKALGGLFKHVRDFALGPRKVLGQRLRRGPEVAKVTCRRGVDRPRLGGVGMGSKTARQLEDGLGDVLVEK